MALGRDRVALPGLLRSDSMTSTEVWYRWRVRSRLAERFGQKCRVLVRGAMNSCLVEFEDGYRVVTSRNYVRRA